MALSLERTSFRTMAEEDTRHSVLTPASKKRVENTRHTVLTTECRTMTENTRHAVFTPEWRNFSLRCLLRSWGRDSGEGCLS